MYALLLTTGILGSLHCIGMCGPLALSLPAPHDQSRRRIIFGRVLYHSARIFSYMCIGLVFGSLGGAFALAGLQQWLSIVAGSVLLLMATYKLFNLKTRLGLFSQFTNSITTNLARAFNRNDRTSMATAGLLNGFLPCGLVYIAGAITVQSGNPAEAAIGMAIFGLGTFPVMFIMSLGTTIMPGRLRFRVNRYSMIFALVIGVLFILRGMNLGIKYISPPISDDNKVECCEPGTHGNSMHHHH